jgi:hypothetical protein
VKKKIRLRSFFFSNAVPSWFKAVQPFSEKNALVDGAMYAGFCLPLLTPLLSYRSTPVIAYSTAPHVYITQVQQQSDQSDQERHSRRHKEA